MPVAREQAEDTVLAKRATVTGGACERAQLRCKKGLARAPQWRYLAQDKNRENY